jgi:hypothetical protein
MSQGVAGTGHTSAEVKTPKEQHEPSKLGRSRDRSSFPFCTPLEGAPTFEIGHSMMECVPDCVILDVTQSLD